MYYKFVVQDCQTYPQAPLFTVHRQLFTAFFQENAQACIIILYLWRKKKFAEENSSANF
ncbi:hypothetical protein HMPREF3293_00817 [Christensenella minuta]|uniref:Uncharacterized protein n=1 Tax=Christensenella minuta TaxID=626937 RepID=A0A136Q618_9FIRM|nr:hypothetical protein HMPREF3293_00817 [Christensenella minuta]